MSFTIQRILAIAPVIVLGLLLLTPAPGLAQAKPDLVVNSLVSPPGVALPGDSFVATASVKNKGTGAAGASVTKFLLVPAAGPRKNLKGVQIVGPLGPGASVAPPATVTIYSDTVPGDVFLSGLRQPRRHGGGGNQRHGREQLPDRDPGRSSSTTCRTSR